MGARNHKSRTRTAAARTGTRKGPERNAAYTPAATLTTGTTTFAETNSQCAVEPETIAPNQRTSRALGNPGNRITYASVRQPSKMTATKGFRLALPDSGTSSSTRGNEPGSIGNGGGSSG